MIVIVGSGIAGLSAALAAVGAIGEKQADNSSAVDEAFEGEKAAPDCETQEVLLVTKGPVLESNTFHAQGGVAVALFHDDDPQLHAADTLAAGDGLCDPAAVDVLTREGVHRMRELVAAGVHFDTTDDGNLSRGLEAAHSRPRVVHAGGDATGRIMEQDIAAMVVAHPKVHVIEHAFLRDLIVRNGRVEGVTLLIDVDQGFSECIEADSLRDSVVDAARIAPHHSVDIAAQAVILATGGSGQLYPYTTNPQIATGDGVAAAWRAGAEVADLEFYQFHPTALAFGEHFLISEAVRGEGAHLLDERGYRYMPDVDGRAELAPRDVVARANFAVMQRQSGRPVYLDVSQIHMPAETTRLADAQVSAVRKESSSSLQAFLRHRFPTIDATTRSFGFDWCKRPLPVVPAAHYGMGGICTDVHGRTSVPGLYAAGECARSGVHGANRLASNSLLEGLVFGHRAGIAARSYCALPSPSRHDWLGQLPHSTRQKLRILPMPFGEDRYSIRGDMAIANDNPIIFGAENARSRIQQTLWDHVGVLRDAEGLRIAISQLGEALSQAQQLCGDREQWSQELSAEQTVHELENRNLLTVGYLSAVAAWERHESRGAHARTDFPHRNAVGVSMRYGRYPRDQGAMAHSPSDGGYSDREHSGLGHESGWPC
jgi:L-aspartate oxidase